MIGDAVRGLRRDHEHRGILGPEPFFHVVGRERALLLVLGDAIAVLARVAQRALVEQSRPAPSDVEQHKAQRAPDRGVGAIAGAEDIAARVHADFPAHGTVDDEERGLDGPVPEPLAFGVEERDPVRLGERPDDSAEDRQRPERLDREHAQRLPRGARLVRSPGA